MKYKSKPVEVEAIRLSEIADMIKNQTFGEAPLWVRAINNGVDDKALGFLLRKDAIIVVRVDGLQGGAPTDYLFYTPQTGAMVAKQAEFDAAYDLVH